MNEDRTHVAGLGRRTLMGGLVAGVLTTAGLELADAKKGGNGKGKGKGKGRTKVQLCHRNGEGFTLISVSQSALKGHEKHGDVVCAAESCQTGTATGCAEDGTCVFALVEEGTECTINQTAGTCSAEGVCVPVA